MEEYKVKYLILGEEDAVTDWMDEAKAWKKFRALKRDSKCVWAELIHSPLDEDAEDREVVVAEFTKRVVDVFSKEVVLPLKED